MFIEGRDWSVETGETTSLRFADLDLDDLQLLLPGQSNSSNLGAALVAISIGFPEVHLSTEHVNHAVARLVIPGRFTIMRHPKTGQVFVLDGAHTVQSITGLGQAVQTHFGIERTTCIVNVLDDKPLDRLLAAMTPFSDEIVFPPVGGIRSANPETLLGAAQTEGIKARISPSLADCLTAVRADGNPVIVTGSFGIVGEAISILSDPTAHEM